MLYFQSVPNFTQIRQQTRRDLVTFYDTNIYYYPLATPLRLRTKRKGVYKKSIFPRPSMQKITSIRATNKQKQKKNYQYFINGANIYHTSLSITKIKQAST